jgi:hypothetical protein
MICRILNFLYVFFLAISLGHSINSARTVKLLNGIRTQNIWALDRSVGSDQKIWIRLEGGPFRPDLSINIEIEILL